MPSGGEKRKEAKSKGEKERYTHLNSEFQRIARRDKKAFLSDLCKEIMSLEMLARRALPLAGIVYNWCREADPVIDADSFRMTSLWKARCGYAAAPLVRLGRVTANRLPDPDFSPIFA